MRIVQLELNSFRNIAYTRINPGERVNLIVGSNGQGKTNLVEAIVFLSWLRSFRTSRLTDLIGQGHEAASIAASVENHEGLHRLEMVLGCEKRSVFISGRQVRSFSKTLEVITVLCLSPDDTAVLDGGPEGRRNLIDRFLLLLDPSTSGLFTRYMRLVRERNQILRMSTIGWDVRALLACEEAMAACGAEIVRLRLMALHEIMCRLPRVLGQMSGSDLKVRVSYYSRWLKYKDMMRELLSALADSRERDAQVGYTTSGPHADDIAVELQGFRARGHASRGQKKLLMLAWKAVEAEHYKAKRGEAPVLVLDDAFADLDADRQKRVTDFLCSYEGQSFITGTHQLDISDGRVFDVVEGTVKSRG